MPIQWFPVHMTSARKKAAETMALTDVVIEVVDARLPEASSNPMIRELREHRQRPCLRLLNKADDAKPGVCHTPLRRIDNESYFAPFAFFAVKSFRVPRRSIMRVLKINELKETPMDTATPIAGWTGGAVSRTRQAVIGNGQSDNFRCNVVNFRVGATTGWHVHDCDQILVVTAGKGFAATENEQREITVGDIVHIKAGERHWHGASAESPLSHITVTTVRSTSKH